MLELQTFGGLELRDEAGEVVEALSGHTKCLALLAYLAVEASDGRVPREQVAALFWPDRTDDRARASLRVALSQVRQATDPVLVAGEGASQIGLVGDHVRADVTLFREALEAGEEVRALELYEGDFLAGVYLQGARRFRRWADRQRGRCRDQAYEAALSVGSRARASGDLATAEVAFRRALDLAPLREEAAEQLIRTLAERGRPADALRLYEAFRQRRQEELEMAPSEKLEALVERIRAGEVEREGVEGEEPTETGEASEPEADPSDGKPEGGTERPESPGAGAPGAVDTTGRFWGVSTVFAVAALAFVIVVFGVLFEVPWGESSESPAGDRSVAVLPFEAIGTENPGPIAAGLHSDLLTRLSNISGLEVISATSVERYRETDLELPAIADSLGVTWVVEGDVQRVGDAIQVHAQLIDPRTDTHAWAETYRRELTAENLFDLQTDITQRIVESLEAELSPGEQERVRRRPTPDLQAYRLYVRGRRHLGRRTAADAREAARYLRQAVERDSGFALAWTALADLASLADEYGWDLAAASLPDPHQAAERALEIAPDLAEVHATLGRLAMDPRGERDAPAAYRQLRRAVALKPSYAEGHHWLGHLQLAFGDLDRAVEHLTTAVELDPELYPAWGGLAWADFARGAPDTALSHIERELAARRGLAEDDLAYRQGLRDRGIALYLQGRYEEAERIARRGFSGEEAAPSTFGMLLVAVEAARGDTARARGVLARMQEADAPPMWRGVAHAALGEVDEAFAAFYSDEAIWPHGAVILLRHWFPEILGPVRTDPRYPELVRQIERRWKLEPDGTFGGLEHAPR